MARMFSNQPVLSPTAMLDERAACRESARGQRLPAAPESSPLHALCITVALVVRATLLHMQAWLVSNGWALAYRRYSTDYVAADEVAKSAKLGLWRGEFVKPWEWRVGQRAVEQ